MYARDNTDAQGGLGLDADNRRVTMTLHGLSLKLTRGFKQNASPNASFTGYLVVFITVINASPSFPLYSWEVSAY